jgi:hypothetical protein
MLYQLKEFTTLNEAVDAARGYAQKTRVPHWILQRINLQPHGDIETFILRPSPTLQRPRVCGYTVIGIVFLMLGIPTLSVYGTPKCPKCRASHSVVLDTKRTVITGPVVDVHTSIWKCTKCHLEFSVWPSW